MSAKSKKLNRKENTPHKVRASLLEYLQDGFKYGQPWTHPVTSEIYTEAQIKDKLEMLKRCNPDCYKTLWAQWTTKASRSLLAYRFNCSSSTIKRSLDEALDTILLLLLYPELNAGITPGNYFD